MYIERVEVTWQVFIVTDKVLKKVEIEVLTDEPGGVVGMIYEGSQRRSVEILGRLALSCPIFGVTFVEFFVL